MSIAISDKYLGKCHSNPPPVRRVPAVAPVYRPPNDYEPPYRGLGGKLWFSNASEVLDEPGSSTVGPGSSPANTFGGDAYAHPGEIRVAGGNDPGEPTGAGKLAPHAGGGVWVTQANAHEGPCSEQDVNPGSNPGRQHPFNHNAEKANVIFKAAGAHFCGDGVCEWQQTSSGYANGSTARRPHAPLTTVQRRPPTLGGALVANEGPGADERSRFKEAGLEPARELHCGRYEWLI